MSPTNHHHLNDCYNPCLPPPAHHVPPPATTTTITTIAVVDHQPVTSGSLAYTGTDAVATAGFGIIFIVGGLGAVWASRKRRRRA